MTVPHLPVIDGRAHDCVAPWSVSRQLAQPVSGNRPAGSRILKHMPLATIEEAIADVRAGKMLIVMDDEDRENEGDLFLAADLTTPEAINFMTKLGRGLICVSMAGDRLDDLHIPMMVSDNTSRFETAFTISVEAKGRTTTGISAFDRAATIKALVDPVSKPSDFVSPGHTFPL